MNLAIIGGGPAGLRAAEIASLSGARVLLFDAMPSVGRKFLVAGKGGLNLTKEEPKERMAIRYSGEKQPSNAWSFILQDFDPNAMREWVHGLGIETFVGTSNRIYPKEMKAAPLLRRWVQRLRHQGVEFFMRHRLVSIRQESTIVLDFAVEDKVVTYGFDAVILALGGASWPQTGSDGQWTTILGKLGVRMVPLQAANCGWEVPWAPEILERAEGEPLKNLVVRAGNMTIAGEMLITEYGLEGGAIYQLGPALRTMSPPRLTIDFKPSFEVSGLVAKMGALRSCLLSVQHRLKLSEGAFAILAQVYGSEVWYPSPFLAQKIKNCVIPLYASRPIEEAISTAGGVCWSELTDDLMLRKVPGLFVCGEMIDWEAPTGGYLIQGSMATGTRAGNGALRWAGRSS